MEIYRHVNAALPLDRSKAQNGDVPTCGGRLGSPQGAMMDATRIFLSYRRDDSADIAGRIFDHLERRFGRDRLFLDVDSIPLGDDFRQRIDEALGQTGLLVAIIGDEWLTATDPASPAFARRLDNPDDYVGLEISGALTRGIPVLPVLVGDAGMPRPGDLPPHLAELAYRNAAEVRSGRDFPLHVNRLVEAIAERLGLPDASARAPEGRPTTVRLSAAFSTLERDPQRLAGVQLGAFVIERLLAAGGSGIAYLARNPRTGQRVCVKISLPVLSNMQAIRTAVARGVRGLVALNHPHIVRIHEFDGLELADARSFYVVMDYVAGRRLDNWAAALEPDRNGLHAWFRVGHLTARALEAAHACRYLDDAGFETVGVMHGDVKPGNIVVRDDGTPALMDFMMVDVQRALDPKTRMRMAASRDDITAVFGTPGFMAPEQEANGVVTVRSDVYGLGATLKATAGRLPISNDVSALLSRMTGPIDGRPADMGEVARLLSSLARHEGLESLEMQTERPGNEGTTRGFVSALTSIIRRLASASERRSRDSG
jgi:hypothetical protein